jgi:multisubunit Na+/H+ antiporter MnhB subunit
MVEIHLILLFMIAASVVAVGMRDLLSSVISVGAAGIGLCLMFLVLKAPDLAMMQLVVEIISLVVLIRATARKDLPFSTSGRWIFNTVCTVLFMAIFLTAAYISLGHLPPFGSPLMKVSNMYLEQGFAKTGALNVVTAVALHFRPLDTLGEATVIFAAAVGILAIARKKGRAE